MEQSNRGPRRPGLRAPHAAVKRHAVHSSKQTPAGPVRSIDEEAPVSGRAEFKCLDIPSTEVVRYPDNIFVNRRRKNRVDLLGNPPTASRLHGPSLMEQARRDRRGPELWTAHDARIRKKRRQKRSGRRLRGIRHDPTLSDRWPRCNIVHAHPRRGRNKAAESPQWMPSASARGDWNEVRPDGAVQAGSR